MKRTKFFGIVAAGILAAAVTACGQKQTEPEAETASTQQTADTVTTASSTEAAAEAVTEAATTAATEAATTAATEASTEAATEPAEQKDPYDLGIQYTDDCVGTLVGSDATMQIVVIGDSQFDIEMAKNANIKVIYCTYGYGNKEKCLALQPEFVVNSAKEIENIL